MANIVFKSCEKELTENVDKAVFNQQTKPHPTR